MMKFRRFHIIFLLLLIAACSESKFENEAELYSLTVQINYPGHYSIAHAEAVEVSLAHLTNSLKSILPTDTEGKVTFENVPPGEYKLTAVIQFPATEAREMGDTLVTDLDISEGKMVNLSVTLNNILIGEDKAIEGLVLKPSLPGELLIKEVFYTGTTTPNHKSYYSDHFIELFNNTSNTIFLDGLHIATVYGANGNVATSPTIFQSDEEHVYLDFVWSVPGQGESNFILPGENFIVAQDGMRHKSDPNGNSNSIDLDFADYETFMNRDIQKDIDFAEVPNMDEVFASRPNTHDFILHSYGPGVVIFQVEDPALAEYVPVPNSTKGYMLMKIPNDWVLDAFEALAYSYRGDYKRIPTSLDAGFAFCNGIFNGESCRRKIEREVDGRIILQDTNNSGEDFEIIPYPTPGTFK